MTRAHTVAHKLLEDGPEDVKPKDFIDQYHKEMQPEHFMEYPARDFRDLVRKLERTGMLQFLRKKYDDDEIGYALFALVFEKCPLAQAKRAFSDLKRHGRFEI